MLKNFITFFTLIFASNSITQAETKLGLETFKISPETVLELTSKSMTFDRQNGSAHFVDDVVVNYGKLTLSAQKLTFYQSQNKNELKYFTFSASGPIIISSENINISGNTANFSEKKQLLKISGNVKLIQNSNLIIGDELILDLEKGIASITGSVKTIINPNGTIK